MTDRTLPPKLMEAIEKVKRTRTTWLSEYGVPISSEFAEFSQAIGELTDAIAPAFSEEVQAAEEATISWAKLMILDQYYEVEISQREYENGDGPRVLAVGLSKMIEKVIKGAGALARHDTAIRGQARKAALEEEIEVDLDELAFKSLTECFRKAVRRALAAKGEPDAKIE